MEPGPGAALGRQHQKSGARKVHDHLAGPRIVTADGDVLGRQGNDFAADFDLAVVVGCNVDAVTGLAAVRIVGIGHLDGLWRGSCGDLQRRGGRQLTGATAVADRAQPRLPGAGVAELRQHLVGEWRDCCAHTRDSCRR